MRPHDTPAGRTPALHRDAVGICLHFRETLTRAIPEAHLGQELPRGQVVVILPGEAAGPLAALPGVTAVARDELLTTLRHDQPGDPPG